ncbi:MAG: hypothetical protein H6815_03945 [Phycisphaeraceae bacterium]|nr:hypothetical protein [Phycisphaerales bacterium]MCB9859582.1 hypothetical protein [Phycisphaeraceae bacterium]
MSAQPIREQSVQAMVAARNAMMALHMYAQEHDGTLPASLDDLARYARPGELDDSAFKYLGNDKITVEQLLDMSTLAVIHLDLSLAFDLPADEFSVGGLSVPVAYADGHVEMHPPEVARWIIDDSAAVFTALADGKELPERRQMLADLAIIHKALVAYCVNHDGHLPGSLGEVFPYVPDSPRHTTMTEKASVLLTPSQRKRTALPLEPTAEWMDRNTSYMYLGSAEVVLDDIVDPRRVLLVRTKDNLAIDWFTREGKPMKFVGVLHAAGNVSITSVPFARALGAESSEVLGAIVDGEGLPDYYDAFHDLRVLTGAIKRYAELHDGFLPAHLGDVVDALPDDLSAETRHSVFVTNQMMRPGFLEEELTSEWVHDHCSYVYIGDPRVQYSDVQKMGVQLLLHSPLNTVFPLLQEDANLDPSRMDVVLQAMPSGWVLPVDAEWVVQSVAESRQAIRELAER